jgi:hypothetical protein
MDGYKELLDMWISSNEGAKFCLSVLTEIYNRGVIPKHKEEATDDIREKGEKKWQEYID